MQKRLSQSNNGKLMALSLNVANSNDFSQATSSLSPVQYLQSKKGLTLSLRSAGPGSIEPTPNSFWDVEATLKTSVIDASNISQQIDIAESGVMYSVRRFNELRVRNNKLTRELKAKLDTLENHKKSYEHLDAMKNAETEESRRIEQVEEELRKVECEISQKTHYTRQLQHMLNRLKKNQIKFDAHMEGMQEAVKALEKEGVEVRTMRNSLDAALSKAMAVCEQTQVNLALARKNREVLMDQRRSELRNASTLHDWMKRRKEAKETLLLDLNDELTKEEEKFLQDQISEKEEATKILQKATEENHRQLQSMEDAFTKLRTITAVSSLEEIEEKFSAQRLNRRNLELQVKQAENRLQRAKETYATKQQLYQDMKALTNSTSDSREVIYKTEEEIEICKNTHRSETIALERINTILSALNQGSKGLLQRLHPFLSLADSNVFELTQTDDDSPWTETIDTLGTIEQILSKMVEVVNSDISALGYDEDDLMSPSSKHKTTDGSTTMVNNVRIKSIKIHQHADIDISPEKEGLDNESETMLPNVSTINLDSSDSILMNSDNYVSRVGVKKASMITTVVAQKYEAKQLRKKRLMDRMMGKTNEDVGNIAAIAKLKKQKEMANRLCTTTVLASLPDGVAVSDHAMTKATAFLMKYPTLQ